MDLPDRPQRLHPGPRETGGWSWRQTTGRSSGSIWPPAGSAGGSSSHRSRPRSTGRSPGTPCTSGRASPPKVPSTLRSSTRSIWPPASNAGGPSWTAGPTSSGPPPWSTAGRSWWPTPSRMRAAPRPRTCTRWMRTRGGSAGRPTSTPANRASLPSHRSWPVVWSMWRPPRARSWPWTRTPGGRCGAARGFPVVAGVRDGLVIAVIEDRLAALDAASGVRRWEVPIERWR